ncbi:MAG: hypothetical protein HY809_06505 [Nitrospirae bacterium]|nr:hypothetical protein [Nitrospirota bacterium]
MSILDKNKGDYLKNIGFVNGLKEEITWDETDAIEEWIAQGAQLEDAGSDADAVIGRARYANHFHDPTKEWNVAGLSDLQFRNGESAILWAQDSAKQSVSIEEDWSWHKIRQVYYWALISETDELRQINFAQTFRGLGHQMHLIQDMAQPAHVRNDAHPIDGKGWMDGLETWTKGKIQNLNAMKNFAPDLKSPQVNLSVDIVYEGENYSPITQLIDTNQYNDTAPDISLTWGLAEYTNSNFVSDDTIFTENLHPEYNHYFPYPRYSKESYSQYEIDLPYFRKRIYLRKNDIDGEPVEHFVTAGPLFRFLDFDPELQKDEFKLDPAVHADYAALLIPRAVGYSAGLLDYFFRGDITLEFDPDTGYDHVIFNNSDEEMEGSFEIYYDDIYGKRRFLWSGDLLISPNGKSTSISFDPPADPKEPDKYILVFSGRMGSEYNAVAGRVVVMPNMELRRAHFIVFRDNDDKLKDNATGLYKAEIGDDRSGYYDTQSILMITAAAREVPEDWGFTNNTQYYWKFRKVSGQAKLVQEGTEPGDRRLYHKVVVNVDGVTLTLNRMERATWADFVTHSDDYWYYYDNPYVYHTDDPLHDIYWNDGYDAAAGMCDSSIIIMQSFGRPGWIRNAIHIFGHPGMAYGGVMRNPAFTGDSSYNAFPGEVWMGNMADPWWFSKYVTRAGNDVWRALSTEENNADKIEMYSAHAPMYPPAPF